MRIKQSVVLLCLSFLVVSFLLYPYHIVEQQDCDDTAEHECQQARKESNRAYHFYW